MREISLKYKFILVFVFILCAIRDSESTVLKKNIKLKHTREAKEWTLVPENPWVLDGGTLMLRLDPSEKVDCPNGGCKCNISAPHGQTFLQKPLTTEGKEFTISGAPDKLKIGLTALGGCYLLISSASYKASSGRWFLNQNDGPIFSTAASVIDHPTPLMEIKTSIGRSVSFNCQTSTTVTLSYCKILDNSNRTVSHECSYSVDPVRKKHIGNWTCLLSMTGSMTDLKYTVSIKLLEDDHLEGSVFLKGNQTCLQCVLKNSITKFSWCRATSPKGVTFLLSPGVVRGKYSAVSTNVKGNKCSLEIERADASDHGLWRIELGITPNDYTGCFLTLPNNPSYGQSKKNYRETKVSQQVVKVGGNLRLECSVPWVSSYCYAIKPDGTPLVEKPIPSGRDRLLKMGVCIILAKNVSVADAGRWTCGLSSDDGSEDTHFYTDVEVMSGELAPVQEGLQPVSGSSATLLCKSPLHRPLKYCRFTNPQGKGFALRPHIITESRFSYYGAGLDEGECGVEIKEVTNEDIGTWICAATFISSANEEYTTITITKLEPSVGFKVGIGLGISTLLAVVISGGVFEYRRRKVKKDEERQRMFRTPDNSTEDLHWHNPSRDNITSVAN